MSDMPGHWYDHSPAERRGDYCLALDFGEGHTLAIENGDEYLVQLCPACGHRMTAYHPGYRNMASDFKECVCGKCLTALFRWTSVVTTETAAAENNYLSTDELQRYVKNRADMLFWKGDISRTSAAMLNGMDQPPTPILGTKDVIQDAVGQWEPRCPVCGELEGSDVEFDFHHWDYERDIGVNICRDCHEHIHRHMTAGQQTKRSGWSWKRDSVRRLFTLASENGLSFSSAGRQFSRRFNIPDTVSREEAAKVVDND